MQVQAATSLVPTPPLRLDPSQLTRVTVCTRPFRAQGPRIEAESFADRLLVHNYGHGGSGWSLSWGSAAAVVPLALAGPSRQVAVIGCGALGLTSAILLQRAGAEVTLYAREAPAATRSARATGTWTPDARFGRAGHLSPAAVARWEAMARHSYAAFAALLGQPARPVELHDRFTLSDLPPDQAWARRVADDPIGFARLEDRIRDLYPPSEDYGPGQHPFRPAHCRVTQGYRFHLASYTRHLEAEFRARGGRLALRTFHTPSDLLALGERVLVNCTGYGARALFGDESLTPVRGQISWLPPQPEVPYSFVWGDLNLVPRTDGTVVQWGAQGDGTGWNDASEEPDGEETRSALGRAALLYKVDPARTSGQM